MKMGAENAGDKMEVDEGPGPVQLPEKAQRCTPGTESKRRRQKPSRFGDYETDGKDNLESADGDKLHVGKKRKERVDPARRVQAPGNYHCMSLLMPSVGSPKAVFIPHGINISEQNKEYNTERRSNIVLVPQVGLKGLLWSTSSPSLMMIRNLCVKSPTLCGGYLVLK